jgi:hypothetical protein
MLSKSGDTRVSQLRLASARRRVAAFLEQIEYLETASFPHPGAEAALKQIRDLVEVHARSLERQGGNNAEIIDGACVQAALVLQEYTAVLGFILRSTNVRNAFELHFPLEQLVQTVIGKHAQLLLSSEWDFIPFLYPSLDLMPNFVLVGAPAPESNNVLLIPLAGHEIGHSAWREHGFKTATDAALAIELDAVLSANTQATEALLAELKSWNLGESDLRHWALKYGARQLEEIFCDLFGLYVFGASYLYAFDYFLAPGGSARSAYYPRDTARIRYLAEGAKALGAPMEPGLFERWNDSSPVPGIVTEILKVTDQAVDRMVGKVQQWTYALLKDKAVPINDAATVARVLEAFKRNEPDSEGASLPEIVTAGWLYLRERGGLARPEDRGQYKLLGELMLKSVEVSEFRARKDDDAQRS